MVDTTYTFPNGSKVTGRVLGASGTTVRLEGWLAYDAAADLYNEAAEDDDVAEFDVCGARKGY